MCGKLSTEQAISLWAYWKPINEKKMRVVIDKLSSRMYQDQLRREISIDTMKNGKLENVFVDGT